MSKPVNQEVANYPIKVVETEKLKDLILKREWMITSVIRNVEDGVKQQKLTLSYLTITAQWDTRCAMRLIKYADGRMSLFDHIEKVKYTNTNEFAVSTVEEVRSVTDEAFA